MPSIQRSEGQEEGQKKEHELRARDVVIEAAHHRAKIHLHHFRICYICHKMNKCLSLTRIMNHYLSQKDHYCQVMEMFAQPELFASRHELLNLWNNENEMCDDRVIYGYLRYLASINNNKRVVVVAPFYTDPNVHYGPGAINLELNDYCYNHTADYDVLLVPVVFPGHFTLLIFDRSNREQLHCLFIDSLPPAQNITR
ncbi:hypothetical protein niasHT_035585 [Heterodera trifolii]|uniref:Ubiquitin-like protease family profile domain-containing protein n=1 Tax=Heterodera trifolii TaxID=157864 RepID=A0ABD2IBM5_9BILA